jgi:hypothetical protein
MEKEYIVSITTIYEPKPIPTNEEDFRDNVDDFFYESWEYFYNCEDRIGFGSRPYCYDFTIKTWSVNEKPYAVAYQRVSILGHCKECAIEKVETWFREHQEKMGSIYGPCDARLLEKDVA